MCFLSSEFPASEISSHLKRHFLQNVLLVLLFLCLTNLLKCQSELIYIEISLSSPCVLSEMITNSMCCISSQSLQIHTDGTALPTNA